MALNPDTQASSNPLLVLEEFNKAIPTELPTAGMNAEACEERKILALDSILRGTHGLRDVDEHVKHLTPEDETVLAIAVSLEDVGKHVDSIGSHSEASYRLLNRHHVALRHAITQYCEEHGVDPVPAEDHHLRVVLWLVRHHEVLEEVFRGERRAVYLDRISAKFCGKCGDCRPGRPCTRCSEKAREAMSLLFVVSLCDSMASLSQDTVQDRIDLWNRIIASNDRSRVADLPHRVAQWTSCEKAGQTRRSLGRRADTDALHQQLTATARDVFAYRIGHIANGAELLRALAVRWKARLLNTIADHYAHNFDGEEVTLSFERRYDPEDSNAARLLMQYENAIRNARITTAINYDKKEIHVACPSGRY